MNASQLIAFAKNCVTKRWPFIVEGPPGTGKSEIVAQGIALAGAKLMLAHPVTWDPTDARGMFAQDKAGNWDFSPFGFARELLNATQLTACVFEDCGQASGAVQASIMQWILARELNGQKIPDCVTFVLITNRRQDNAAVSGIITPLRSRFRSTVELVPDAKEVAAHLLGKGAPVELCAFLNLRPEMVNTFDPKTARDGRPFACPRTISFLADFLNAGIDCPETLAGCVGEQFAVEFMGFRAMFKAIGNLPAQILTNPQTAPIPQEIDRLFAISAALTYHATVKNIDALGIYFDRFDGAAEFRTFFWKTVTARKPEIAQTNAHSNWFVKHGANDVC